ncbi:Hypothetical protein FKW44_014296, partial [Caligus rogercresseyi]
MRLCSDAYTNCFSSSFSFNQSYFVFPIPRRPMRSTTPVATFACHKISVWNMFKAFRSARTLHAARTAAKVIGRS